MGFVVYLRDGPDGAAIRDRHLAAHLEFVERHMSSILVAGPLLDDGGTRMIGSLYVLDVADREAASGFLAADPYHQAGLWDEVEIRSFRGVAGTWVGGRNW